MPSVKRLTDAARSRRRGLARFGPIARILFAAAAAVSLAGCSIGYVARAGYEEARILWNRKAISTELDRPNLSPEVRSKLETVLKVRKFAADKLGLDVGGAYESVSQIDESAVVHVVMAAPRDSLKPYRWWFPVVGFVPYRGYFSEANATAEADRMEAAGYDTMVRPAIAFSSLGFFDDPVLSDLLGLDRVELAGVLIHELFHRTCFLPGEIMFDESAANWVGTQGAVDFFAQTEGESSTDAAEARAVLVSNQRFARFLLQAQARLLRLYMSGLPKDEILSRRKAVFAKIKASYAKLAPHLSGLDQFDLDKEPLNNAVMVNYLIYFHDFDNFVALERMHHGDTRAAIKQLIDIANSHPYDPFYALWQATRGAPTATQAQSSAPAIASVSSPSNPPKK